ncbi:ATP synthase subunit I [uncultured Nevskia sp.]|uniref:ATP synthase subunit I n=1 Tax=uncultured Nevskia sp. TaxID=228950 RepID=UPI0025FD78AD|nr:ATP synthase subunit I [uncultured Nevskia sp.]
MKTARRIAQQQLFIALLGAVIWTWIGGIHSGLAAAVGGGIAATLTFYAALKTFGKHSDDPNLVVTNFFRAQMRKFALSVVLFAVAVKIFGSNFAPLITTFAVALLVYWWALTWDS